MRKRQNNKWMHQQKYRQHYSEHFTSVVNAESELAQQKKRRIDGTKINASKPKMYAYRTEIHSHTQVPR